ncbi:MAG: hypothetical protein ABS43_00970 [Bordetella sp. SCN 67-23]|nr:hypothetical protein [Burkholderiales bacterium]ODS76442.1 MAG: hypothetical protein ABS43_00970 [Bordetella sp. SCN 67-23]OJW86821.1 MAG: hypothetical protein BGO71_26135 [Burkholderiales bacterium 67-32]
MNYGIHDTWSGAAGLNRFIAHAAMALALVACGGGDDGGSAGNDPSYPDPSGGLVYSELAVPLQEHLAAVNDDQVPSSPALATNIVLGADFYGGQPRIITANYGFDGYMGVPGLVGTDSAARLAAQAHGVAWADLDPALDAPARAHYSAVGVAAFRALYGVEVLLADTIPVVFSHPVLPASVSPEAFRITLNDGSTVTPITASFIPNLEYNERQTVVLTGYWGNRVAPGQPDAQYPTRVDVVDAETPMMFITPLGLVPAAGLGIESANPYVPGNGPRVVAAKLNLYSSLGEGGPQSQPNSSANSGEDLYGAQAEYRLRIYTSAGFSPDGIGSIRPVDYERFFLLKAKDRSGGVVELTEAGKSYAIDGYGAVRVVGLADTGLQQESYDAGYVEDHDNQYDIILSGDLAAVARIFEARLPSSGAYAAVYNPGGPGSSSAADSSGAVFTVPSQDHGVAVTDDLAAASFVSYVEIDGAVARDSATGQPQGRLLGPAIIDTKTGYTVNAYEDPDGKRFFASFPVSPAR